jgi:hypothetical protein
MHRQVIVDLFDSTNGANGPIDGLPFRDQHVAC